MAAGPYTALSAITLTTAEKISGYTANTTNGGPDVPGLLQAAIDELYAVQLKLTEMVAVLPSGSNKTAISAQLTVLSATS